MKKVIFIIFLLAYNLSFGQKIQGKILSADNKPVAGATIKILGTQKATLSNKDGLFSINVAHRAEKVHLIVSFVGMYNIDTLVNTNKFIIIHLRPKTYEIEQVQALGNNYSSTGDIVIKRKVLDIVSTLTGNAVEALIMTSMGVQTNNELSSQYSVRGGSYDENLVYIDGIEIIRPVLIRSGQQEGLSIINPDFVRNIKFSAGGFAAHYGDKMSSVLDISYKTPKDAQTKITLGLTGASFFHQNNICNSRLSFMIGTRLKQNSYLLNALPTKGNYKPLFSDFQTVINYKFSQKFSLRAFGYMSINSYDFFPDSLTVAIGTFTQNFRIPIAYQGAEKDKYNFALAGLTMTYRPESHTLIQWINSFYDSREAERYTIGSAYRLDMVQRQIENNKDSAINIGVGYFLTYSRNYLSARVMQSKIKTTSQIGKHTIMAGIGYRLDRINDRLARWKYIDSAGYSFSLMPQENNVINLYNYVNATNFYQAYRINAFAEDFIHFYLGTTRLDLNLGLRYTYFSFSGSTLFSPRFSVYLYPNWINMWTLRFSSGYYYQIPFYNELRDFTGHLVHSANIQKSIHYVLGAYHNFRMWGRPFKFSSELYYKDLKNIIPFEYNNLRIQYYAHQKAHGYAAGLDMRIYGEFVPNVDSWISLSFMHTAENIDNDAYWQYLDKNGERTFYKPYAVDSVLVEPGYMPRATDQLVTVGLFFQDYMPTMKNMRMNMSLFFGSGRPYGPPTEGRYKAIYRMPPYLRADIGFLYVFHPKKKKYKAIFEIDLFNALGVMNVASYNWLTILTNSALIGNNPLGENYMVQIATPNYLTGRLVNFKVKLFL